MRLCAILALALLAAAPAAAFEWGPVDRDHVYVSEPGACRALEGGFAIDWDGPYFTALSFADGGIYGLDLGCDFYQVHEREGSEYLLVDAICHELGYNYPDQFSIGPWDDGQIQVVSRHGQTQGMTGARQDEFGGPWDGATIYHACEGLAELPL